MISYFPTIFRLPLSNDSISTAELTTMAEAVAVVGLIAAIIQIVDLGKSIVQRLQDFRSKTNEIPGVFRDICTQLPLLLSDLERTKEQAKASEIDLDTQKSVLALVQGCQGHIQVWESASFNVIRFEIVPNVIMEKLSDLRFDLNPAVVR